MSPRTTFELELQDLKRSVAGMGAQVKRIYDKLFLAAEQKNQHEIEILMKNDRTINDMERSIEAKCLHLITKQQPIARDLRVVSASLKVVTDIERIGDQVVDMAELILRLEMKDLVSYSSSLAAMIQETRMMLDNAVDAFVSRKKDQAEKVVASDDIVDNYFNETKMQIVEGLKNDTISVDEGVDILMLAKYLEKIADHAVNISNWEIFQESGFIDTTRLL